MNRDLLIETKDLTKRYGSRIVAVDSLNLNVWRGEVYGFLGPNGLDPKGMAEMRELIRSLGPGREDGASLQPSHGRGRASLRPDRRDQERKARRRRLRDRASPHSCVRLPKKRRGVIQDVSCGETASEIRCNG